MASTSRTRNTKELLCAGGAYADYDGAWATARCLACDTRHRVFPDGRLVRHVPPPLALKVQVWDGERYVDADT